MMLPSLSRYFEVTSCIVREMPWKEDNQEHMNVWPHTAHIIVKKIGTFGWEAPLHPLLSPDLVPSDYCLLSYVKEQL